MRHLPFKPAQLCLWACLCAWTGCESGSTDSPPLGSDDGASDPAPGAPTSPWASPPADPGKTPKPLDPGAMVVPNPISGSPAALQFDALKQQADAAATLDAHGALASYPTQFRAGLSYEPMAAAQLQTIQSSALALSDPELAKLAEHGFVVSTRREFPTFMRGLAEIYASHLPLYVSADALLESIHSSYDNILASVEARILIPDLHVLLIRMHDRLASSTADKALKAEVDVYLSVARGLLDGVAPPAVAGANRAQVEDLVLRAVAAQGMDSVKLFGLERLEDFSQFEPRGHYAEDMQMQQYFRAMIWLGRIDLRLLETLSDGKQVFRPEQYRAMLLLNELLQPELERWRRIDDAIRTFVGESDSMVVPQVARLVADLGGPEAAQRASDDAVVKAIVAGGYGEQQIASHLMVNDGTVETLPLNRSFLLFGQRYIPDSHVFSEAVYDRVGSRMMPNPLDAAFAALGNNQALALEQSELDQHADLPGALARMRVLIDAHGADFWQANFYNLWLKALRALSPAAAADAAGTAGLPEVAQTEAWGRRILNTQLGSWSELRHDTLLYAKQSYTGIPGCEFPDVYVDPYPELYDAIVKYAEQGGRIVEITAAASAGGLDQSIAAYFDTLRNAASRLAEMARAQRIGQPFTAEQLAFINDAVRIDREPAGCVTIDVPNGWYADLFYERDKSLEFDPTIADVHTQPADEAGNPVGKVLHVGTGYPRYMVTTIDTCNGPRAYAGVVYAYHEHVTENFERLTDQQWAQRFAQGAERPGEVPWLAGVLAE
jgi:hypothetical protein